MNARIRTRAAAAIVAVWLVGGSGCGGLAAGGTAPPASPAEFITRSATPPTLVNTPPQRSTVTADPTPRVDYRALRDQLAGRAVDELHLLPDFVRRFESQTLTRGDVAVLEAVLDGHVHEIAGLRFGWDSEHNAVGYWYMTEPAGESRLIAWLDGDAGHVVEVSTGYELNVLNGPGTGIAVGPNAEQFYVYGWTYYDRWRDPNGVGRVLPEPVVHEVIEAFYREAVEHVRQNLSSYQATSESFGGDLRLIGWDRATPARIAAWRPDPQAPPIVVLPDSRTVDVSRARFQAALDSGMVVLDEQSVERFMRSEVARNGRYRPYASKNEISTALLTPYRYGESFGDLEAAIILAATFGGGAEPFRITIDPNQEFGVYVPELEKQLRIAPDEVANVILGFPGALNARWTHEANHILDFRVNAALREECLDGEVQRVEPVKYFMEILYWIRMTGNAWAPQPPEADWVWINAGLQLARLLSGEFPNSTC